MTDQPTINPERSIVIKSDGSIQIVGRWRVGELLQAAQQLANAANGVEIVGAEEPQQKAPVS